MIDVQFNGVNLAAYGKVLDVRRDVLPPRELATEKIPTRAGSYLFSKRYDARVIEIDLMIIGDVTVTKRQLASVLNTEDVAPLELTDEPGLHYKAILHGSSEINDAAHTGTVTLSFYLPDPHAYGNEQTITLQDAGSVNISGNAPTHPVIEATFTEPSSFLLASLAEDPGTDPIADEGEAPIEAAPFVLVGDPGRVDQPKVSPTTELWRDNFRDGMHWQQASSNEVDGTVVSAMGFTGQAAGGLRTTDYGTGSGWHGGAMKRSLSEQLQDFRVHGWFEAYPQATRTGTIAITLLDVNGVQVGRVAFVVDSIGDSWARFDATAGTVGTSGRTFLSQRHADPAAWQRFYGRVMIERIGNRWYAQIARDGGSSTPGRYHSIVEGSWIDTAGTYDRKVAQIAISGMTHGTFPAMNQIVRSIYVNKINQVDSDQTELLFNAGDVVTVDCGRGQIRKNGDLIMTHLDVGSDFFALRPGLNPIGFAPATADIKLKYRSKWI